MGMEYKKPLSHMVADFNELIHKAIEKANPRTEDDIVLVKNNNSFDTCMKMLHVEYLSICCALEKNVPEISIQDFRDWCELNEIPEEEYTIGEIKQPEVIDNGKTH